MEKELREEVLNSLYQNGCDIESLHEETDKLMSVIEKSNASLVNEKMAEMLPEIKKNANIEALKQVRDEYRIAEGIKIVKT